MLIGLVGKSGAGKNHIGRLLAKEFDLLSLSFSLPLKSRVYSLKDEWSLEEVFLSGDKPLPLREFLQKEGTERGREAIRQDIWIRAAEAIIFALTQENSLNGFVFTDVRFLNEADFIRNKNGVLIKINNENAGLSGSHAKHKSETELESIVCDIEIDNTKHPSEDQLLTELKNKLWLL